MLLYKFILITIIGLNCSYAYTNFISYGYQSCLTCHYNPFGNGPLTDYGRALGATLISDNSIAKKSLNEEERAEISGFIYGIADNNYIKGHANYRGLLLKTNIGDDTSQNEWINMMANIGFTTRPTKSNNFIIVTSIGYAPEGQSSTDENQSTYRSREHYIGYRTSQKHGLYLGMMDKVFGLRIPDHNSYSKTSTNLTMNDGAHGFLYHGNFSNIELGLQYFLGNLSQAGNLRPSGFTSMIEYNLSENSRIGLSYLSQSNSYLNQTSFAYHMKFGFSKGSSILFEYGLTTKDYASSDATTSSYIFLQNYLKLKRGLYSILTTEYFTQDTTTEEKILKIGPALQYFPFVGMEFRVDFYNYRTISTESYSNDTWTLAGQVHLWL